MFLLPKIAHAESFSTIARSATVQPIMSKILDVIVKPLIEGFFLLAVFIFIWGLFGLIAHGEDSDARKKGQNHILWGVVGMFIMITAYGIVRLIGNTVTGQDPFQ